MIMSGVSQYACTYRDNIEVYRNHSGQSITDFQLAEPISNIEKALFIGDIEYENESHSISEECRSERTESKERKNERRNGKRRAD